YYLEIQPHSPDLHKPIAELSKKYNIPLVATQDSHYVLKEDKPFHEILLAIQTNNRLDDEDRLSLRDFDASFTSQEEMTEKMKEFPEALENTLKVAEKCQFEFQLGKTILPKFDTPNDKPSAEYLKELILERFAEKFPNPTEEEKERLEYEISVIGKTGFEDYFLIVQDYVNWAKDHGIVVGPGRGSAAGSFVSYVLGITGVNPIKYGLLFERFLNPERISMPDIDIDFADYRRDEVMAYLKDKYGEERVAQIITFGTMAARASVRDAGRALGLPYSFCDELAKMIPFEANLDKSDTKLGKYLEEIPELKERYKKDPDAGRVLTAALNLEGTVRHASVHACGIVISATSLVNYLPLQRSPQDPNAIITQIEMHGVEDLGLLKMDLLGLRNLTIIEETLRLIKNNTNEEVDIDKLPLDDAATFKFLQTAETTGIFQFESAGMRRYMKDLKPTELEDLVALGALYRPGPIELIPSFINRKHGREKIAYLHPKLEPILKDTYGIGVYQEQMMRIARDLAGFTLPESDTLRKAIGKKVKSLLDEQQKKLIDGMIKNGIDEKTAEKIWELFPPFARYGFNKSHAVCYGLISYQTAYLKTHYPVEFMTALLNHANGDTERITFLAAEAERMGIKVLPPDINKSLGQFFPEEKNIRYGLATIKNLGANITEIIVNERMMGGPYQSLSDFMVRVSHRDLNKKSLESLTKTGALDSLGVERQKILFNMDTMLKSVNGAKKLMQSAQDSLFGAAAIPSFKLLEPENPAGKTEKLAWEKELLGIYFTEHPLVGYLNGPAAKMKRYTSISRALELEENKVVRIAGVIIKVQRVVTKSGQPMVFAKIDDLSNTMEVLIFNSVLEKNQGIIEENNIVDVVGKISKKNGEAKILCNEISKINI
ncbi:MAG: DNA polymerase III subunit alpha, partial [Patescibacteria group bacterium]|nr:DNA polymerase III subunit alpha [Patescibacteria group bacterium]